MPSDSIFKVSQRSLALAALVLFGYIGIWVFLAFPFSPFPSDETSHVHDFLARAHPLDEQNILYYWLTLIVGQQHPGLSAIGEGYLLLNILDHHSPGYYLILYSARELCISLGLGADSCRVENVQLFAVIASNAVIAALVGAIVYELTENLYAQAGSHAVYAFSAWPITYHYITPHAVVMTACVMLALWLMVSVFLGDSRKRWRAGLAGAFAGLALWVSPSAPLVVVGLVSFVVWLVIGRPHSIHGNDSPRSPLPAFLLLFLAVAVILAFFGLDRYFEHFMENINSEHYDDAALVIGTIPAVPHFTYFRILLVYGEALFALTLLGMATVMAALAGGINTGIDAQRKRIMAGILFIMVFCVLLVDLLPTTRLARSQFMVYPLTVIVICMAGHIVFRALSKRLTPTRSAVIMAVAATALSYEGAAHTIETVHVRTSFEYRINEYRRTFDLYMLCDDPHLSVLLATLNWNKSGKEAIRVISLDRFAEIIKAPKRARRAGLLIGPHGQGSGRSVTRHSSLSDFDPYEIRGFDYVASFSSARTMLPYYMYYPPFLLEEEISQALYFAGMSPDYRRDSAKNLTLLQF